MNRRAFLAAALAIASGPALLTSAFDPESTSAQAIAPPVQPSGALLWSDEFSGPAGSTANPANWAGQLGRYGHNERQYYTASSRNAWLNGSGQLLINPRRETAPDGAAAPNDYTSARLVTRGLQEFTPPVRIQANIKLPAGSGIMPAFWSLGADPARPESWPHEGEADMMEAIRTGYPTSWLPQTLHGPSTGSDSHIAVGNTFRATSKLDGGYHRYGMDWYPQRIDFTLDGAVTFTVTAQTFTDAGGDWTPFSGAWPHYLLLNTAVIGASAAEITPQPMLVDWVRVWSLA